MPEKRSYEPAVQPVAGRAATSPAGGGGGDDDLRNALQAKTSLYCDDETYETLAEALSVVERGKTRARKIDTLGRAASVKAGLTPLIQRHPRS